MIIPKVTYCKECSDILPLIEDIDCKIFELSKKAYNNIVFGLGQPINMTLMIDLLNYKEILTYKFHNEDFAPNFSINMIANKVKLLKYK